MKPFKLAYVTVGLPGHSSGEEFFLPEIQALRARGYSVTIIPRENPSKSDRLGKKANYGGSITVGLADKRVLWTFVRLSISQPRLLLKILTQCCFDPKFSNILKNLRVVPKGIWLGKLVRATDITHIHAQWAASTATMAEIAHCVSGTPWSFTLHRGDIVQNNRLKKKFSSAAFARFISQSSAALYERVAGHDPLVTGKAQIIHMGVAIPPVHSGEHPVPTDHFRLICPANLIRLKGHVFLFEAIDLLRRRGIRVTLVLAGTGPMRSELEQWVRDHNLQDRVTFAGQQEHSALLASYTHRRYDAAVLPSIDLGRGEHEGIPVSLMEAMAHSIPVISTETGGIPELLGGGAGVLVPARDSGALASAIESLATNHDYARRTANLGRERVVTKFNIEVSVQMLSEWFEAIRN
jgi:glycosyltransferase involved in cell wall biosynthesis